MIAKLILALNNAMIWVKVSFNTLEEEINNVPKFGIIDGKPDETLSAMWITTQ